MSYDKDKIVVTKEEYDVLKIVAKMETCDIEEVAKKLNVDRNALMRKIAEMERKGLLRTIKKEAEVIELTNEGKEYIRRGLPEEHILDIVTEKENISIEELYNIAKVRGIDRKVVNIGIMHLARLGVVKINKGYVTLVKERLEEVKQDRRKFREFLSDLIVGKVALKDKERYIKEARRRKLIQIKRRSKLMISITDSAKDMLNRGAVVVARLVTRLTPELITSGKWREVIIKPYDLSVEVPEVFPGRKHPYMEFLDQIREILVSMGFEEVKGPHIELEFWNFDALFQAQDHPAREIHDTFFLRRPRFGVVKDSELMEKVKRTHENGWITGSKGWRYKWNPKKALRLILRTQTTSVSVRTLRIVGNRNYKAFSLDRNFRPEALDATHSMEFYQCEGIVVGRNLNFRHLLGFLKEFSRRLGLEKVKFKPAYFPFTEPSVEGYVFHPKLGWIEALPGGMFRPEVLAPLGIKYRVLAWGIGIDRLAMVVLGLDDIRDLFNLNIGFLRSRPNPIIPSRIR